ncbi:MAG: hypothetical protein ACQEQ0_00825 [Bacteroidota bacterium]
MPYILQDLHIHKMPGLPTGIRKLEGLSPNINLITGPNASGKSSTARLIKQLIWHNQIHGMEADASVLINNREHWDIKIEYDKVSLFHDGRPDSITGIPPAESSHRYLLALQDMVVGDDKKTAEAIIKESSGGYDPDAVNQALKYSSATFTKRISEYLTFEEARHRYNDTVRKQEKIKKEEEGLNDLYQQKEKTEHDRQRSEFFRMLSDYFEKRKHYQEILLALENHHKSMDKVSGDELQYIEKYEKTIREAREAIDRAKMDIQEKSEKLGQLTIHQDGIPLQTIEELKSRTENLAELSREIHTNNKEAEGLKIRVQESLKAIDPNIHPDEWEGLDLKDVQQLDQFLQKAHQVSGQKNLLEKEKENIVRELEAIEVNENNAQNTSKGIETLRNWLTEQQTNKQMPSWLIPALVLTGAATATATLLFGLIGFSVILVMAVLWMVAKSQTSKQHQNNLHLREQDFEKTGLTPPETWHNESVINRMNELLQELNDIYQKDEKYKHLSYQKKNIEDQLNNINNQYEKLKAERESLKEKIQTAPGIPDLADNDFSSLVWFIENVKKWQEHHQQLAALQAQNKQSTTQYKEELALCNKLFSEVGFSESTRDASQVKALLQELNRQETARSELSNQIQQLQEKITNNEQARKNAQSDMEEIYKKLDIDFGDKNTIRQLMDDLPNYKSLKEEFHGAKANFESQENDLKKHPKYAESKETINQYTTEEARAKSEEFKQEAAKLESIIQEITRIEKNIIDIKNGQELEDELAGKEKALEDLENIYHKNISSYTGSLIIDELKTRTRDQNRPEVFKQASRLFNRITAGHYELRLDKRGESAFTAYDTVIRREHPLPELSTGTRLQLLLAVRLAFIEKQEQGIKLPILADELLANSDDERASAIIQSLMEISREGRQIFYFTAQVDEIMKWQSFLQTQNNLEYKTFSLKEVANTPGFHEYNINREDLKLSHKVPEPGNKTHIEYGRKLEVPEFNIINQEISSLHLWYLIEKVELLYQCLSKGIKQWGQLESFLQNGGEIPGMDEQQKQIMADKAGFLRRFKELYTIGRPRPINREVLQNSGLITERFIDPVSEKLAELNGDPEKLLNALNKIPRFQKNRIPELRTYLIEQKYLDENEPISTDEIMIKLQAFISKTGLDIDEAERTLKRILH